MRKSFKSLWNSFCNVLQDMFTDHANLTFEGEKVWLRPPIRKDFTEWAALREDSWEFLQPWEPEWKEDELTYASFRQRIKKYEKDIKTVRGIPFLIFTVADNRMVGGLTLSNIRRSAAQCCTLGYWMGREHAEKGLMRDSIVAILPFVFTGLNLHRLEASCIPSNIRSMKLLDSLGFRKEGIAKEYLRINGKWQDHNLYAMTIGEWKSKYGCAINEGTCYSNQF